MLWRCKCSISFLPSLSAQQHNNKNKADCKVAVVEEEEDEEWIAEKCMQIRVERRIVFCCNYRKYSLETN